MAPGRLYHLGGDSFAHLSPHDNSGQKYTMLPGAQSLSLLSCQPNGSCESIEDELAYNHPRVRYLSSQMYFQDEYQEKEISASARLGDVECQIMTAFNPVFKNREEHQHRISNQLLLACYLFKDLKNGPKMMVAMNHIQLYRHHQGVKNLQIKMSEREIEIVVTELNKTFIPESEPPLTESVLRIPSPGDRLQHFDQTREAFHNVEIEHLDYKGVEESGHHRNSLGKEFSKKYSFLEIEKKKHYMILLEDENGHLCIDVSHRRVKQYPILTQRKTGSYTWSVSDDARKLHFWTVSNTTGVYELTSAEFELTMFEQDHHTDSVDPKKDYKEDKGKEKEEKKGKTERFKSLFSKRKERDF